MKKLSILIIISLLLTTACFNKEVEKINTKRKVKVDEIKETYKDSNNTPIGIYNLENNSLKKNNYSNKTSKCRRGYWYISNIFIKRR